MNTIPGNAFREARKIMLQPAPVSDEELLEIKEAVTEPEPSQTEEPEI